MKRSKVFIAGLLAGSMMLSQPAPVLAQELPADFEELEVIEDAEFSEDVIVDEEDTFFSEEEPEILLEEEDETPEDEASEDIAEAIEAELTAAGFAYSEEQRAYKESVIEHAGETDFASKVEGEDYTAGEVIAMAASEEEAEAIALAYHGTLTKYSYGVANISLEGSDYTVARAYDAAITNAYLPAVEPNYITLITDPVIDDMEAEFEAYSSLLPADWETMYYDWGYDDPALNPSNDLVDGITYQWFHDTIHTYSAWAVSTGSSDVTVAVIDTGVRNTHEELSGKVILPTDLTLNFPHNEDHVGHGTHVATIVAGKKNNGVGGAGVAPDVKILGINASIYNETVKDYVFQDADEARAILYVAGVNEKDGSSSGRRADIINMSLGGPGFSAVVNQAVQAAIGQDVTIVAAMGNSFANCQNYPAAYDGVVAVAAVDMTGARASFSNSGSWCAIAAPGYKIYSATSGSDSSYDAWNGTSMASPVVAGACALYMSVYGHTSPYEMRSVLKKSVSKSSSSGIGAGIVDLAKMFGGDVKAPTVTVLDAEGNLIIKETGSTASIPGVQSAECKIGIAAQNFTGSNDTNSATKIAFSYNGKDPSLKNGVLTNGYYIESSTWQNSSILLKGLVGESSKQRNLTLKFAAITGMGVIGKVTTIKLTVEGTQDTGWDIVWTATKDIYRGSSATYKAKLVTNLVTNKALDMDIDDDAKTNGATFVKGKLSIPEVFAPTYVDITAISQEKPEFKETYRVYITNAPVSSVFVETIDPLELNNVVLNKKTGSLTSLTLYNVDIDKEGFETDERRIFVSTSLLAKDGSRVENFSYRVTSSNNSVARYTYDSEAKHNCIRAYGPGTATLTFTSLDGTNKKTKVKVKVVVPASHVSVTAKNNQTSYVAFGKSVTSVATVGSAYGKPSSTKVNWSYQIVGMRYNESTKAYEFSEPLNEAATQAVMNTKLFSFSKGKLKIGKISNWQSASGYIPYGYTDLAFDTIATTTDGTNCSASARYILAFPTTYIYVYGADGRPGDNFYIDFSGEGQTASTSIRTDGNYTFDVKSSNPKVLSGFISGQSLVIAPHKRGTVTLTIKALDGTGYTKKIKVQVR